MNATNEFQRLLARVRAGDESAATELVRQREAEIRRLIRLRLTDPNLRRCVDTLDIFQSVFAQFFVRVRMGQFDLADPSDLTRLLTTMVKNKVRDKARKPVHKKTRSAESGLIDGIASEEKSPSEIVSGEELAAAAKDLLSESELSIVDWRDGGKSWEEIGIELDITPEAARKRLKRALDRVFLEIGIENHDD